MGLFDLIQQDHRVRLAAHRFGQITALLITDITWRCADQTSNGVLLHELGHIDADHGLIGIEQKFGQRLAQLGFAHTGRPEKHERTTWPVWVTETRT